MTLDLSYLIIGSASLLITGCITTVLIYQLYCKHDESPIPHWFKFPSVFACLSYTLSCIAYILCSFYVHPLQHIYNDAIHGMQQLIAVISFTLLLAFVLCAKLFIYITFLSRLYLTFVESVHKLSKCFLRFMILLLLIFVLTVVWFITLLYLKWYFHMTPFVSFQIQLMVVFVVLFVTDIILSVLMVFQFLKKLFLLITARRRTIIERSKLKSATLSKSRPSKATTSESMQLQHISTSNEQRNSGNNNANNNSSGNGQLLVVPTVVEHTASLSKINDEKEDEAMLEEDRNALLKYLRFQGNKKPFPSMLNDHDIVIIDAMTKYSILNILAIITSFLSFGSFLFLGVMHVLYDYYRLELLTQNKDERMFITVQLRDIVIMSVFPLDSIVNCSMLLLNFKFSEFMYFKLCGCVHDCIQIRYAYKVERKLKGFSKIEDLPSNHENSPREKHRLTEMTVTTSRSGD